MITNTKVERKNDHFLDLLERMKAFNSELKKERKFEPHHRSLLAKTVIDNWHHRQKNNLVSTDISINMTDIKNSKKDSLIETIDERIDIKTLKTTLTDSKEDSHIVQKKLGMIEVEKERSPTEIIQTKNLDIIAKVKEKGMIRKDIIKEMLEKIERQNDVKIEAICKKLDIREKIENERQRSTLVELVNKGWTNNSPRNNDSLKEKIDERLKSIERSMIYTQNDSLTELTKKIEILNSPLDIDWKRDITVLNNTESSDNEKIDRHIRNTICHKCKQ